MSKFAIPDYSPFRAKLSKSKVKNTMENNDKQEVIERIRQAEMKIKCKFEMPVLIEKQFVIFRDGYTRKNNGTRQYKNDWVALNRTDRRPYSFGQGKFIASDGNIILSGHKVFDEVRLIEISPDYSRDLFFSIEQEKWDFGTSSRVFVPPKNSKFCTFQVRVLDRDDRFLYNTEKLSGAI